jgi:hypothetical protein
VDLGNLAEVHSELGELILSERHSLLSLEIAIDITDSSLSLFRARLRRFEVLALTGRWEQAEEIWDLLDPMGRSWPRPSYAPGEAELSRLDLMLFPLERLTDEELTSAESLAHAGHSRPAMRGLLRLRGKWQLSLGKDALAAENLQIAIQMAHETGMRDEESEVLLALAGLSVNGLPDSRQEARRLSTVRDPSAHLPLAQLWQALGETDQAIVHAKAAYRYAWADGEPFVRRHQLNQAATLLNELGADPPALPAYDPARYPISGWEHDLIAAIREYKEAGDGI